MSLCTGTASRLVRSGTPTTAFHNAVDMPVRTGEIWPGASRLVILKDWITGGEPHAELEGGELSVFVR